MNAPEAISFIAREPIVIKELQATLTRNGWLQSSLLEGL
jgi:hypothetical protein